MSNEMSFDIKEYKNIIKRWKWIVILITLLSTIAAIQFSKNSGKADYVTSESIIIGNENDATNNQNLIKTYIEIAKSNEVAEKASAKLNGAISSSKINNSISVDLQPNTSVIIITVSDEDKKQALDIIKSVSQSFIAESQRLYPNGKVQVMDYAKEPETGLSSFTVRNTFIAFLIGLMASMSIVALINFMDTNIKSEDNIEKELGLPVIGNIQKYR